jgi:hypothetical protein
MARSGTKGLSNMDGSHRQAADGDLMISPTILKALPDDTFILLADLFAANGRRAFRPDPDAMPKRWHGPDAGRRFIDGVAELHAGGYLRQLPSGEYEITTRELMSGAEYRAAFPDAAWGDGLSWPGGETAKPSAPRSRGR